jgi:hypothetical protein
MAAWAAKQNIRFLSISFLIAQGAKASKPLQFLLMPQHYCLGSLGSTRSQGKKSHYHFACGTLLFTLAPWAAKQHIGFVSIYFLTVRGANASKAPTILPVEHYYLPWLLK